MFSTQKKEELRHILETLPDGLLFISPQQEIVKYNDQATSIIPALHEHNVENWLQLIDIEDRVYAQKAWEEAQSNDGWVDFQARLCHHEKLGVLEWRLSRQQDKSILCIVRNLRGPFQHLSERKLRLRKLYEETPVLAHAIDEKGRLLMVSQRWLTRLGYTREEVLGRPSTDFLTKESQERAKKVTLPFFYEHGYCHDVPYQMIAKDGEIFDIELSATSEVDSNGKFLRSFAVITEVTQRNSLIRSLSEKNALLEAFFEAIPGGVGISSVDRKIIRTNSRFREMLGYTERELRNAPTSIVYANPEEFQKLGKEFFNSYQTKDAKFQVRLMCKRKDGTTFPMQIISAPIYSETGESAGFLALLNDVTKEEEQQRQLDQQLALLEAFFEAIPYVATITDKDHNIIRSNNNLESVFGYTKDDVLGQNTKVLYSKSATPPRHKSNLDQHVVVMFQNKEGLDFPGEIIGAKIKSSKGDVNGYIKLIRDITHDIQREQELENKNNELEQANKDLERFAYIASHDLQEPLRKISAFLSVLEEHLADNLDETGALYFNIVRDGAERMNQLIRDLLAYSRSDALPELEPCNMIRTLLSTIEEYRDILEKANATIQIDPITVSPDVLSSPSILGQIFSNLLSNSVKYAHPNRQLKLNISIERHNRTHLKCSIKDNGIGIAPKHHERIFEIFQRLHRQSEIQGQGIGLALCKKIIEKQNGQFGVESDGHSGSTFWFTLKRSQPTDSVDDLDLNAPYVIDYK